MPLYSIYLVSKPRGTRQWIDFLDAEPSDWVELKEKLREVAHQLHVERGLVEADLLLQKHLPGKFFVIEEKGRRVHYRREDEAAFTVVLNPRTGDIYVKGTSFSWELLRIREEIFEMERGKRWRTPPLIPWEHRNLSNPKTFLMEPSSTRYPDYSRTPRHLYALQKEGEERRGLYEPVHRSLYAPRNIQMWEKIQEDKKKQVRF